MNWTCPICNQHAEAIGSSMKTVRIRCTNGHQSDVEHPDPPKPTTSVFQQKPKGKAK
jgi:hypothetical protein